MIEKKRWYSMEGGEGMQWVYDPHRGGVKISERTKERTRQRILAYAMADCSEKMREHGQGVW